MSRSSRSSMFGVLGGAVLAAMLACGCAPKNDSALPKDGATQSGPLPDATPSRSPAAAVADAQAIAVQKPTYPFDTCVVCDQPLTAHSSPQDILLDGRLVRVCCEDCGARLAASPAASFSKIDAAIVASQTPGYPLTTCVIEGGKLGEMGEPVKKVYGTRLVQFCCADCVPEFAKDPAAALAKIDAAYADAQRPTYPVAKCPLMNQAELGSMGEPVEIVYGTRLVRLCCEVCVEGFWKNPEAAIAAIDAMAGTGKVGT